MVPFLKQVLAGGLLTALLVVSAPGEELVQFVPQDVVSFATQGNRIAFDFRRWPARPIQVYADALGSRSNFLTNAALVLDTPGDFICYDRSVFILSNVLPDRTYQFFFASYIPRDRTLFLSGVYTVTTAAAEALAPGLGGPTLPGVPSVVTQFVTNTVERVEKREVVVTNEVVREVTNWPFQTIEMQVDYDNRVIRLSGDPNGSPQKWFFKETRGGQGSREPLVSFVEVGPRQWAFEWRVAPAGGAAVLEYTGPSRESLFIKSNEVYFPDAGAPQTTNVAVYPSALGPYQPVGPLELFAVMNLFQNGLFREADVILGKVPFGENPGSSRLYWQAVLDYCHRGDVEGAVSGFYRVIKLGTYRAEVFRSYLWIAMIFLKDKTKSDGRYQNLAREYLDRAYGMSGESDLKDDILYYQAVALKAQGQKVKLSDHLRFIKNARLVHSYALLWDIETKRTVELLPHLAALEAGN